MKQTSKYWDCCLTWDHKKNREYNVVALINAWCDDSESKMDSVSNNRKKLNMKHIAKSKLWTSFFLHFITEHVYFFREEIFFKIYKLSIVLFSICVIQKDNVQSVFLIYQTKCLLIELFFSQCYVVVVFLKEKQNVTLE